MAEEDSLQSHVTNDNKNSDMDESNNSEVEVDKHKLIEGFDSFEDFMKAGFRHVIGATLASNKVPNGDRWDYYKTFPSFQSIMDDQASKVLELMSLILQDQGCRQNIVRRDLEEKYDLVVETNDFILERVGINLDELSGIRQNPPRGQYGNRNVRRPVAGSWNRSVSQSNSWKEGRPTRNFNVPFRLVRPKVIERSQLKFKDKIDNRSSAPFEPRIKEKPNALQPLAIVEEEIYPGVKCFSHPYEYEIDRFVDTIKDLDISQVDPLICKPLLNTPFMYVNNKGMLVRMMTELRTITELAVDLEHHSYRSFQGFTCLLQMSTREKDYIVDTLELRSDLYVLNEVFTNPKVVKVFHGADMDIQWLQRDLSLYVVNMFDTCHAATQLALPKRGLAFLLKSYCNIHAQKYFQLYDWRTRPLSRAAMKYAREDTHYLLYIYDLMRNMLIDQCNGSTQGVESVLFQSAEVCKKRYWKTILTEHSHMDFLKKTKKYFNNRQLYALRELYTWRDKIARDEDESTGYILPNHMLLRIAQSLPREVQGLLACCTPVPPLVRQNVVALHQMILKARELPLVEKPVIAKRELKNLQKPQNTVNLEGPLHCPHDLTQEHDFRTDLPTLLGGHTLNIGSASCLTSEGPQVTVYKDIEALEDLNVSQKENKEHVTFISPYERYKKVVVYLNDTHIEEANKEKKRQEEAQSNTEKFLQEMSSLLKQQKEAEASGIVKIENPQLDEPVTIVNTAEIKSENVTSSNQNQDGLLANPGVEVRDSNLNESVKLEEHEGNEPNVHAEAKQHTKKKKRGVEVIEEHDIRSKKPKAEFEPFDYSQVDFNKFQTGQATRSNKEPKERFKAKAKQNPKFTGKSNNKNFTFSKAGRSK